MTYKVNIKRFPIDNKGVPYGNYLIVGRRGSGKTVFIDHLVEKYDNVVEYCDYRESQLDVTLVVRDTDSYNAEIMTYISKLVMDQKLDSVIWEAQYFSTSLLNRIHFDYIVLLGDLPEAQKRQLYNMYNGRFHKIFRTYDLFEFTYERCTLNYNSLILKLHAVQAKPKKENLVFQYKVPYDSDALAISKAASICPKKLYVSEICLKNDETSDECYHFVIINDDYDNKELWPCSKIVDYIMKDDTCTHGGLTVKQVQHFMPHMLKYKQCCAPEERAKTINIIESYKCTPAVINALMPTNNDVTIQPAPVTNASDIGPENNNTTNNDTTNTGQTVQDQTSNGSLSWFFSWF